jgi:dephospho-CoA kinase
MAKPCLIIGITGGVATGKSSFSRHLHQLIGGQLFDADRAARDLQENDPEVRESIRAEFGPESFFLTGELNRDALRGIILADKKKSARSSKSCIRASGVSGLLKLRPAANAAKYF